MPLLIFFFRPKKASYLIFFFSIVFLLSLGSLSYSRERNKYDVSVRNRKEIVYEISRVSGLSVAESEKLFREIYLAAIDHYYYDKYMIENMDFCEYFSTVLAIIENESRFDKEAIARRGRKLTGVGLMQINYSYWKKRIPELKLSYLYDAYFNVRMGSRILLLEISRGLSLERALLSYVGYQKNHQTARRYRARVLSDREKYYQLICSDRSKKRKLKIAKK